MKKTSISEPSALTISYNRLRQRIVTIAYDIEKTEEGFAYMELQLRPGTADYPGIVSQIITQKYPSDQMQAIVNNYLADPSDATIAKEFQDMQAWRTMAKRVAKEILADPRLAVL